MCIGIGEVYIIIYKKPTEIYDWTLFTLLQSNLSVKPKFWVNIAKI